MSIMLANLKAGAAAAAAASAADAEASTEKENFTSKRSHHGSTDTESTITTASVATVPRLNLDASLNKKIPESQPTHRSEKAKSENDAPTMTNKKKKKLAPGRVPSAVLLSKAKASEGSIPLPLISQEQDRRPFFYYNGQREDDLIEPTIENWSKYVPKDVGETPRERAIKFMTVANTFKDKPWLGQVRIALKLAANPTKRNVRRKVHRLKSASSRTLSINNT